MNLFVQLEIDFYRRLHLGGPSVHFVRLEAPPLDGVDGGTCQDVGAAERLNLFDRAISPDDSANDDQPLGLPLERFFRISRFDAV